MPGIYRRENGIWYIRYSRNRKEVRKSLGTKDKREAQKIQREVEDMLRVERLGLIRPPEPKEETDTDVKSFWVQFSRWAEDHKTPKTVRLDKMAWDQFIAFCEPRTVGSITRKDVEDFKSDLLRDGVKPISVNAYLRHLKSIFNRGIELDLYSGDNPFVGVSLYKIDKNPPKFLTRDEVDKLLQVAEAQNSDVHLGIALAVFAGLRKKEFLNARWEWVDFGRKLITVKSDEHFAPKNRQSRTIPLHDELADILRPHKQDKGYIIRPKKRNGKNEYRVELGKPFHAVLKEADLKGKVSWHGLRHTFASLLAQQGISLYKVQKWLGHSDSKITQIYAHLQAQDEEINRL